MTDRSIDIVIVNYHGAGDVATALDRLGAWPHGTVWLVDNSDDAAQAAQLHALAAACPHVRVRIAPGNLGFGRGCNLAFAASTSDYVLLLNPDARVAPGDVWLLAQALDADARLDAASPAVYWNAQRSFVMPRPDPQTPRALASRALATRWRGWARRVARREVADTRRRMRPDQPAFAVDMLAGAVLMLRRSAVERAGGLFDPGFFMFFEDADLSWRLRRAGSGLALVPQAGAVHEYRHKAFKAELMAQSQRLYLQKNHALFLRCVGGLAALQRWSAPVDAARWVDRTIEPSCRSAADLDARTQGAGVLALTPSPLMAPAMVRTGAARPLDAHEWALLEPGWYAALLEPPGGGRTVWTGFVKAAAT